jgi:tripartite-type tricarboxylate transporter receptor subunit TctC
MKKLYAITSYVLGSAILLTGANADPIADFYRGKTVDMLVGYQAGGGYDIYARAVARHIGKQIPGQPAVIVKNMDGAGGLRVANFVFQSASKDGSVIASTGRGAAFDPLFGNKLAQFDGRRFGWIGSANSEVSICVSIKGSGVDKFEDLYDRELIIAGTGAANDTDQIPKVINGLLNTRFRLATGYPTGAGLQHSMERRETFGRCGWSWSSIKATHPQWVTDGTINLLVQVALQKHSELPHVPLITDFAKTPEQREVLKTIFASQVLGRPFFTTPDVPRERLAALRRAFDAAMVDKEFLAEAEKLKLEVTPVDGVTVETLVNEIYRSPTDIVSKAGALMR